MKFRLLLLFCFSYVLQANDLHKVTLQLQWKHQFEFAGFYAAKYKGYYKEAGLDVELIEHQDGLNQIQEVIDNKKTFGIWGTGLISSALQGKEVIMLANYFKRSPLILMVQPEIRLPSDLKDKKLMISNMDFKDAGLQNMLTQFNIGANDIEIVTPSYDINDLASQKVDAYLAFLTNEPYFLQQKGVLYNILDPNNYGVELYDLNLFTSKEYYYKNPKIVKTFVEASNKGWEYALKHKEEIVDLILSKYNTQFKSKEALLFEANETEKIMLPKIYPIGSIDPNKIRKIAEIYTQNSHENYEIRLNDFVMKDHSQSKINLNAEELNFIKNNIVRCITNATWSPFNMIDDNGMLAGIALDYWNLIIEKTGLNTQCKVVEHWSQALDAIQNDNADITLSTTKTSEREKYSVFTKPYASYPIAIATRNDHAYISDISTIKNLTIAVGKNTSAHQLLLQNTNNLNFIEVTNIEEALELLSTGEVDAAAEILPVLAYMMNKHGYSNLKISGATNFNFDVMMMVNDDKKVLASIINKAIDSITQDERKLINNKWISVKFEQSFDYSLIVQIVIAFSVLLMFLLYRHLELLKHKKELNQKNKELEKSKKELHESNRRLSIAAQVSFDLLYERDVKNNQLIWYGDIDTFLGYKKDEISLDFQSWLVRIHPEDKEKVLNTLQAYKTSKEPINYEYRIMQKDGDYQYWEDQAMPILSKNGKPKKWIGVCTNITQSKKLTKQLMEKNKMASMGEMIGNIAHQWRQPLSVISSGATGLKLQKEFNMLTDEFFMETCDSINENAQYLSKTIDDFRNFISQNTEETTINTKQMIDEFLNLMQASIKAHNIQVQLDIEKNLTIVGYKNELIQCFMNLFNNSKDALKEKCKENERYLFIKVYKTDKNTVIFTFLDNGGAIDSDIIERIFEPYFTTKHKSKGTGLGLHMTYNMISQSMNGSISVENLHYPIENKYYNGAEFKIELPL